ncbi:hypothetical protein J2P12_08420, partial [Candidatus Bathyarchaeota archaeon]|nr:hypothetical protein [Candidatus Bathyarchaeota archaeon]
LEGKYHTQLLDKMLTGWKPHPTVSSEEAAAIVLALKHAPRPLRALGSETRVGKSSWRTGLQPQPTRPALYVEGV